MDDFFFSDLIEKIKIELAKDYLKKSQNESEKSDYQK